MNPYAAAPANPYAFFARLVDRTARALALAIVIGLAGCETAPRKAAPPPKPAPAGVPADFAIDLLVLGPTGASQPADQTTRYVLEPNRSLRIGVGPGAAAGGFPPVWGRLARAEVTQLWRQIERDHLLAEPTSPMAETELVRAGGDAWRMRSDVPLYRVHLACGADEHTYWTTGAESPPTLALLARLREAAGLDRDEVRKP